jgi:glycerol 3-phosphatase-2
MPDGPWPATGAILAALEHATGATALSVGKPEPWLYFTALDRLGEGRALVVGDRIDSDLGGAAAAQLDAAVVLTGASTREETEMADDPKPVAVAETLADLVLDGHARRG